VNLARAAKVPESLRSRAELFILPRIGSAKHGGAAMGFGKGLLLWLIGIPLPIILLLALFWR